MIQKNKIVKTQKHAVQGSLLAAAIFPGPATNIQPAAGASTSGTGASTSGTSAPAVGTPLNAAVIAAAPGLAALKPSMKARLTQVSSDGASPSPLPAANPSTTPVPITSSPQHHVPPQNRSSNGKTTSNQANPSKPGVGKRARTHGSDDDEGQKKQGGGRGDAKDRTTSSASCTLPSTTAASAPNPPSTGPNPPSATPPIIHGNCALPAKGTDVGLTPVSAADGSVGIQQSKNGCLVTPVPWATADSNWERVGNYHTRPVQTWIPSDSRGLYFGFPQGLPRHVSDAPYQTLPDDMGVFGNTPSPEERKAARDAVTASMAYKGEPQQKETRPCRPLRNFRSFLATPWRSKPVSSKPAALAFPPLAPSYVYVPQAWSHFATVQQQSFQKHVQPASSPAPGYAQLLPNKSIATPFPLLNGLASKAYSYCPSPAELHAITCRDPAKSLSAVENFTVVRAGVGSARWLDPVDVRGVDLETVIQISQGRVTFYAGEKIPPVGVGFNGPVEITLLNMFCKDQHSGRALTSGPEANDFKTMLDIVCKKTGLEFKSYCHVRGVWKFQILTSLYNPRRSRDWVGSDAFGLACQAMSDKAAAEGTVLREVEMFSPSSENDSSEDDQPVCRSSNVSGVKRGGQFNVEGNNKRKRTIEPPGVPPPSVSSGIAACCKVSKTIGKWIAQLWGLRRDQAPTNGDPEGMGID